MPKSKSTRGRPARSGRNKPKHGGGIANLTRNIAGRGYYIQAAAKSGESGRSNRKYPESSGKGE